MMSKLKYLMLGLSLEVILSLVSISKNYSDVIPLINTQSIECNAQSSTIKDIEKIELSDVYIVSKTKDKTFATTAPKYPTVDDLVTLYLVLEGEINGEKKYFSEIGDIIIDGKKIQSDKISKWDSLKYGSISVEWFKVEPTKENYSNTNPEWHFDKINYAETPFKGDDWSIDADVNPTLMKSQNGRGTMRFKIKVNYGNTNISTPGAKSYGKTGIKDNVHRISVRGNTGISIIDWAYSFMNQPYIWGSGSPTGKDEDHQSERYIGADCADFVVASARKAGHNINYGGSYHLSPLNKRKDTKFISREPDLSEDGSYRKNGEQVKIDKENVRIGDVVLYIGHVGILTKDLPPIGVLSSNDLIIHTLFNEPVEESISQAYSPPFSIVRFNK